MYYQHFGLSGAPFQFTPASGLLYMSNAHREGLAALEWGLQEPSGFTLLVGDAGTGKTTLVYSLLARKHPGVRTAYVTNPKLSFEEMLRLILGQLGVKLTELTRYNMLQALNGVLAGLKPTERVAVIVDEAQDLSDATLEELRLLSNFETTDHKPLQMVLVGQIELLRRLSAHELRQLNQRIGARAYLPPLNAVESRDYIAFRLHSRNGQIDKLFVPRALKLLVRHGRGNPRRINVLCHNSMLLAYAANASRVEAPMVRSAAAEYDGLLKSAMGDFSGRLGNLLFGRFRRLYPILLSVGAAALLFAGILYSWPTASPQLANTQNLRLAPMAAPAVAEPAPPMMLPAPPLPVKAAPPAGPSNSSAAEGVNGTSIVPYWTETHLKPATAQNPQAASANPASPPGDNAPRLAAANAAAQAAAPAGVTAQPRAESVKSEAVKGEALKLEKSGEEANAARHPHESFKKLVSPSFQRSQTVSNLATADEAVSDTADTPDNGAPADSSGEDSNSDPAESANLRVDHAETHTAALSDDPKHHGVIIRDGDTLSKIAQRFVGPDSAELRRLIRANPQVRNINLIYPGQMVYLPGNNHRNDQ